MTESTSLELREFAPNDHTLIGCGRKPNSRSVEMLAESIAIQGQIQVARGAPIPCEWRTIPSTELMPILDSYLIDRMDFGPHIRYVVIAGNTRRPACRKANKPFRMELLPALPPPMDVFRDQLAENLKRKNLTGLERALYLEQFVKLLPPDATEEQLARAMGMDVSTLRLHLAPTNIPLHLRPKLEGLGATIACRVGQLKEEQMEPVLDFAQGGTTLASVNKYIQQLGKTVGRKPKHHDWKINGRTLRIETRPGEKGSHLIADLEEAAKRLRRFGDSDANGLGPVFA